jgi:hypothetical protein
MTSIKSTSINYDHEDETETSEVKAANASVNGIAEDPSLSVEITGDRSRAQDFAQRIKADWQQVLPDHQMRAVADPGEGSAASGRF